jgi:hypothetical protein
VRTRPDRLDPAKHIANGHGTTVGDRVLPAIGGVHVWRILGTLPSDLSRLVGAQSTQIWTLSVLIRIQPTSAQNGGNARAYEVLGRSHSVRPGSPTCRFRSPI